MPLVERRYAEALVNISSQAGAIEEYYQEFQSVVNIFNQQDDFRFFLLNPEVRLEAKKDVIKKVFSSSIRAELINFLLLLIDKGRISYLPAIFTEFVELSDKKRNVLNMTIVSAFPLEDQQINEIRDRYKSLYNPSSVKIKVNIDKSLVGGIKLQIGDKVIDSSLKGRLEGLKKFI